MLKWHEEEKKKRAKTGSPPMLKKKTLANFTNTSQGIILYKLTGPLKKGAGVLALSM